MNLKKFIIFSKNKFTVTISDDKHIAEYTFFNPIKIIIIVMIVGFVISVAYVTYLYMVTSKLKEDLEVIKSKKIALMKQVDLKHTELDMVINKLGDYKPLLLVRKGIIDNTMTNKELVSNLDKIDLNFKTRRMLLDEVPSGTPLATKISISSPYGRRISPITNFREFHKGVDLRAELKSKVHATADGIVEFAGYSRGSGYGNLVILTHNFGFRTTYAHLYKVLVKSGSFVKKGDIIALSGSTGKSTGPHLHYEIRYLTILLNPKNFLYWNIRDYKNIFSKEKRIKWKSLIEGIKIQIRKLQQ